MEYNYKKHIKGYYDEYKKEKCKICFNAVRIGCGSKIIDGEKIHFNIYGCEEVRE